MVNRRYFLGNNGQSAVFDAALFFIILMSASVFVFIIPSVQSNQNKDLMQSDYRNEFVESTLNAVLKSTVKATSFSKYGTNIEIFDIDIQTLIKHYLELKCETRSDPEIDLSTIKNHIENAFRAAIPSEYYYSVNAIYSTGSDQITETVAGSSAPKITRYSSSFEIAIGDEEFKVTLTIWT